MRINTPGLLALLQASRTWYTTGALVQVSNMESMAMVLWSKTYS